MPIAFDSTDLLLILGGVLFYWLGQAVRDAAFAHAARALGDPSACDADRGSLLPWAHLDRYRSVLLPVVLAATTGLPFGCGKPLPLDVRRLARPRRDVIRIALAGPAASLAFALLLALALVVLVRFGLLESASLAYLLLLQAVAINGLLCVVHLIPLPPLDAARILSVRLPTAHRAGYEGIGMYGVLFLVAAFFTPLGEIFTREVSTLPVWIEFVAQLVIP